jgi:hypothetical protein
MTGYAFRIRLSLPAHRAISHDGGELRLTSAEDVRLIAQNSSKIAESKELLLIGRGYDSPCAAKKTGRRWRGVIERISARFGLGVDFGDRAPSAGGLGHHYRQKLETESGRPIRNNRHGLQVFKEDPWPMFAGASAALTSGFAPDILVSAAETGLQHDLTMSEREMLAHDLFAASFFQAGPDACYLTLMAALEALIEPTTRPAASVAHVNHLIDLTDKSGLPKQEIDSLVGSLRWLRNESIGQAGRQLVAKLGSRQYMDGEETPAEFFSRCYDLRSRLAHGHMPRPTRDEIGARTLGLQRLVGDLLSNELLDAVDVDAIVAARNQA